MKRYAIGIVLCGLTAWLRAAPVAIPNGSFEQGAAAPEGWTAPATGSSWEKGEAADGERFVTVTGSGDDNTYWRSGPVEMKPAGLYRLSFMTRSLGASGGTAVTGPVFCNRDIGCPPPQWTPYTAVFACPSNLAADQSWLRFGQWHTAGRIAFDAMALTPVQAVYAQTESLELGDGESLDGNAYEFRAALGGPGLNHSRPLAEPRCGFNSNRWVFGADSRVLYGHTVGDRQQTSARGEITVGWHAGGRLVVEVSTNRSKEWRQVGTLDGLGTLAYEVPADLLPALTVTVRLGTTAAAGFDAAASDPGSFQVHGYTYAATVDGKPVQARGKTTYVAADGPAEGFKVDLDSLGEEGPGGPIKVDLHASHAQGGKTYATEFTSELRQEGREPVRQTLTVSLPTGPTTVPCTLELPGAGMWQVTLSLGQPVNWSAKLEIYRPEFYAAGYGELLPGSTDAVALWRASSGWKVPRTRALPTARAEALQIRAAGNEAEAVQLVLRPTQDLRGLAVVPSDLRGPGQTVLPAACIEVLKVRYVPVTQATDASGVLADWPDPLPPLSQPLDLAAGLNQPLWIRVSVPAGTPAGTYQGLVALQAAGYTATVPVQVAVYGFDLPKRMTCQSAFGFDPSEAWRYQGVTDAAQRRQVLELYWRSFAAHRIAPYNPAPMDSFGVAWPTLGSWQGGTRDREVKDSGTASLRLQDTSPTATVSARYNDPVRLPPAGLRLRFRYRTAAPGHTFLFTLNHHDAGNQWLSGRNNDIAVAGDGSWQTFEQTVTAFPDGAASARLTLWATRWSEAGEATGGVWIDGLSVTDAATGQALVEGGDFEPAAPARLVPQFDWSRWDTAMARAIDEYGFNSFRLPIQGLGGGTFHSRDEPELLGFPEASPEYQAAMQAYLGAIEAHLRAQGWLDEAFVYWFDEPDPKDYEFVMGGFRKLKQWAPGLRRMLTEQVEDGLLGGPDLWCPLTPEFSAEKAAARRQAGERFWWYVCTGPKAPYATLFIDHPGTELRVWLWQTWERAIDGILVWQSNYWTSSCAYPDPDAPQNPYLDPMGWVSGYDTPKGTKQAWGNGDGRFIYPPEAAADGKPAAPVLAGPVDSIRWEMLRDGIEDYEYFAILRRLLQEKGARLDPETRQRCEALLTVPASVSVDLTHFSRDPAPLEAHRHLLGQAIADLAQR